MSDIKMVWKETSDEELVRLRTEIRSIKSQLEAANEDIRVLRKNNSEACDGRHTYMDMCADLNDKLKSARAVIEFYGNKDNYVGPTIKMTFEDGEGDQFSWYGGRLARQWLKENE